MPYTMLGTAASSSIATPTGFAIHGGASSTRNSAMTRLSGTATARAIAVDTSVP